MNEFYKGVFKIVSKNIPATQNEINKFETRTGVKLPSQYKDFLLFANGAEGNVGENYLVIWSIKEVLSLYDIYMNDFKKEDDVNKILQIGSDGATWYYAFDKRVNTLPIIGVDSCAVDFKFSTTYSDTFEGFLDVISRKPIWEF